MRCLGRTQLTNKSAIKKGEWKYPFPPNYGGMYKSEIVFFYKDKSEIVLDLEARELFYLFQTSKIMMILVQFRGGKDDWQVTCEYYSSGCD